MMSTHDQSDNNQGSKSSTRGSAPDHQNAGGGFLDGLTRMLQSLGDLADKGQEMKESGLFETQDGKQGRFSYGVRFGNAQRSGGGDANTFTPKPFRAGGGDPKRRDGASAGGTDHANTREPIVDVFDDDELITVIAEMPGVGEGDLALDAEGVRLTIRASASSGVRYQTTVVLPGEVNAESARTTFNNGVVEINFPRGDRSA